MKKMHNAENIVDVMMGDNVIIPQSRLVNLYGCTIGDNTSIGAFVEIQKGAIIGANCKIGSHSFICEGVAVEDDVFIGHGVVFCNDNHPRAVTLDGQRETDDDWRDRFVRTYVRRGAVIGSNVTILGGVIIGEGAVVGAGAVVTKDVKPGVTVVGNPARLFKKSGPGRRK